MLLSLKKPQKKSNCHPHTLVPSAGGGMSHCQFPQTVWLWSPPSCVLGLSGFKPLPSAQAQQTYLYDPLAKGWPEIWHLFTLSTGPTPWATHARGLRPGVSWKRVGRSWCCVKTAWMQGGEGKELLTYFLWAPCHVQAERALPCQHYPCLCQRGGAHHTRCPSRGYSPFPLLGQVWGIARCPPPPGPAGTAEG